MHTDPLDLIREMLQEWLKTAVDPRPSWETVVTALRSPLVNEKNVAAQLESKYCLQVQHVDKESNRATKVEETKGIVIPFGLNLICS